MSRPEGLGRVNLDSKDEWLANEIDDVEKILREEFQRRYEVLDNKILTLTEALAVNADETRKLRMAIVTAAITVCLSMLSLGIGFLVFK